MPLLRRVFYGWYVVAAVLVITTAFSGFIFYNLSILLAAFVAERGFPVALASSATATFFLAAGVAGVAAGWLVDRVDARLVISGGAALAALALASAGTLHATWQLFAFHVVFGLAHGTCGLVPVTTVIARWFNVHRSLAFSIGSTGLSLGGIAVAPFVALAVEQYGLDATAPWMALSLFLGIVPLTLLVVRPSPQAMGLGPDGIARTEAAAAPPPPSTSFQDALRSGYFHAVSIAYLFLLGSQVAGIAHLYRLASTRDGADTAALALAVMAATSTIGRLIGGALLLRVPARTFALAMMVLQAVALAGLAWAHGRAAILAGVAVFGFTMGNSLMMHPLLLVERFGTRDYGRIYSVSQLMSVAGLASGAALVGVIYEASGGYTVPFATLALASLVGFAILAGYGPHRLALGTASLTPQHDGADARAAEGTRRPLR
ncbi:MAG TPA: MFS transporter [Hyphomicrobiaceae bacterium]|jgi:MFS family permease|nr:MFS transporter [Hyphomicrobiaceae bacterium]